MSRAKPLQADVLHSYSALASPDLSPSLRPRDREGFERPEDDARLVFQLLRLQVQGGEPLHQGLKRLLPLHPRQGRPQTMMDARPKGDMQVRGPGDVKLLRRGELLWVPIGRGDKPPGAIERLDSLAT